MSKAMAVSGGIQANVANLGEDKPRQPRRRRTEKEEGRRVNLQLSARGAARLDRLEESLDASTSADTIRQCMMIAELVVEELENGNHLYVHSKDGQIYPFRVMVA